ncbi:TRAP transporter small permease subunit [Thalassotalea sp. LPB0316]|uniref:TRAP transporter small permease subunit n=1 Tax=Thalassotalea sp. LPB0316 TaxID=2769490 RepID=UPI0018676890|nr:TRAP transporter small permease subunit [Thalassotalea sp. LPB0316]QOL26997.1 TRAP transporter small permease subunit [Thalassotalea sp. LPB0316]
MPASSLSCIAQFIDTITDRLGRAIIWLTLVMVLLTFLIVLLRYGFNIGFIAMQESVLYLHGIVIMLGAAFALKEDAHVRVDIFYQKFSQKQQALVNALGIIFLLLPVCLFFFYISLDYVLASWRVLEKSSEAGGLPFVYLNKTLLLLLPLTLFLQGISELCKSVLSYQVATGENG